MNNFFLVLQASFSRSLKNYTSYKINFVGEIFFSFATIMFIFFISRVFEGSNSEFLKEYDGNYFLFLFTGIGVLFFITRAFSAMIQFATESQTLGYIETVVSTKTPFSTILFTSISFPIMQAIFRIFLLYSFSFIFTDNQISILKFLELVLLLLFVTAPFIGICYIFISILIIFKRANFLFNLFLLGCSIFSGIFYPLDVMPDALSNLSILFPSTFSVELIRERVLENAPYHDLAENFFTILLLTFIYLAIGLKCLKISINYAKIKGTLSHF